MAIIPKRNENNMTGSGTPPQALDVNMPNPQISGVQPVGGQDYLTKPLNNLMEMVIKAQEDANNVVLLDTHNQLNAFTMGVESNFMRDKKGKNALDINEPLKQARDKVTELTKPLNKKVAEKFRLQADNDLINLNKRLRDYSNREGEEYRKSVFDVSYQQGIEQVKANYLDNKAISDIAGNLFSIIGTRAEQEGWADEVTTSAIFKAQDDIHSGVILKKLEKNDDIGALQYYTENERDISENQKSFLREKLKIATVKGEGLRIANKLWEGMSDSDRENINLLEIDKKIQDEGKGDTEIISQARNQFNYISTLYNNSKAHTENIARSELYSTIADNDELTISDIQNMSQWNLIRGEEQAQIITTKINREKIVLSERYGESAVKEIDDLSKKYGDNYTKIKKVINEEPNIPFRKFLEDRLKDLITWNDKIKNEKSSELFDMVTDAIYDPKYEYKPVSSILLDLKINPQDMYSSQRSELEKLSKEINSTKQDNNTFELMGDSGKLKEANINQLYATGQINKTQRKDLSKIQFELNPLSSTVAKNAMDELDKAGASKIFDSDEKINNQLLNQNKKIVGAFILSNYKDTELGGKLKILTDGIIDKYKNKLVDDTLSTWEYAVDTAFKVGLKEKEKREVPIHEKVNIRIMFPNGKKGLIPKANLQRAKKMGAIEIGDNK